MVFHLFGRVGAAWGVIVPLLAITVLAPTAEAQVVNNSRLSGYVYIDRNNDGVLAFSDQAKPELVIPGVTIKLFHLVGTETVELAITTTDSVGRYEFTGLAANVYGIQQEPPIEYVDGLDAVGTIRTLMGDAAPPGAAVGSAGGAGTSFFTNIVLPAGTRGDLYNFGERGLKSAFASKRALFATAPPPVFTPPPPALAVRVPEPTGALLAACAAVLAASGRRRAVRPRQAF